MKRKWCKISSLIVVFVMLTSLFTACGSVPDGAVGFADTKGGATVEESVENSSTSDFSNAATDNRKIIENIELSVETKEFDELLKNIKEQIATLGGYIESNNTYGNDIEYDVNRSAEMVVRIPSQKSSEFSGFVSENSVVVSESVTTEDVTLKYVDMESRLSVLRAEKEALEELLKKANTMEDIIKVREQLTTVIQDIESYESQLRTYDNLVDYTTVRLYIEEVERTTVAKEQGVWKRIGQNLANGFDNVKTAIVEIFVFGVSAIPYLIPIIIVGVVVIFIIRISKRNKGKKDK